MAEYTPRVPQITQFDGGPLANKNCMMAAGAMLARLAWSIVTTGSALRACQSDQTGGTGFTDLAEALRKCHGKHLMWWGSTPSAMRGWAGNGFGLVVAGDYDQIPLALRLQPSFTELHAVYVDAWMPADILADRYDVPVAGGAYWVMDPIGRPSTGYRGAWWPQSVVEAYASKLGGGTAWYAYEKPEVEMLPLIEPHEERLVDLPFGTQIYGLDLQPLRYASGGLIKMTANVSGQWSPAARDATFRIVRIRTGGVGQLLLAKTSDLRNIRAVPTDCTAAVEAAKAPLLARIAALKAKVAAFATDLADD